MAELAREKIIVEWINKTRDFEKGVAKMTETINKHKKKYQVTSKEVKKANDARIKSIQDVEKAHFKQQRKTLMGGLSLMFFFMQMNRVLVSMATTSFATFNKMNAGTEAANNGMARLSAMGSMLQYALGSAFAELAEVWLPKLIPMIEWLFDFMNEHPMFTSLTVGFAIITTALLAFIGQFSLLVNGVTGLTLVEAFKKAGGAIKAAGTKLVAFIAKFDPLAEKGHINFTSSGAEDVLKNLGKIIAKWTILLGKIVLTAAIWIAITGLLAGDKTTTNWVKKGVTAFAYLINYILYFGDVIMTIGNSISFYFWDAFKKAGIDALNIMVSNFNKTFGKWTGIKMKPFEYEESGAVKTLAKMREEINSGERWKEYQFNAIYTGELFDAGMKDVTDALGITKVGDERPDYLQTFIDSLSGNKEVIQNQLSVAELQKEAAESTIITNNTLIHALQNPNQTQASSTGNFTTLGAGFSFLAPSPQ